MIAGRGRSESADGTELPGTGRDILVVLDGGTESVRAAAVCAETGTVLASAARPYPTHTPQNGWAEQNSADWWAAVKLATRACLASAAEVDVSGDQVRAVSFVTTTCTLLPVGVDGPLCPAMLWSDVRAAAQAERIFATGHAAVQRVSCAGFSAVRERTWPPRAARPVCTAHSPLALLALNVPGQ